jgi:hydroxymethylpyrimidine pyrophosphatase-like HAD family hydrolase
MQYTTIILGDFSDSKITRETAMIITPIVDSENLNYSSSNDVMILCFESSLSQTEVYDYISAALYGEVNGIIVSKTDNLSVFIHPESSKHLFGENGTNVDTNVSIDMQKVKDGLEGYSPNDFLEFEIEEDDEEDIDEIQKIITQSKTKTQIPTIDDLLDKICEKGYESLTSNEKKLLQKLSK